MKYCSGFSFHKNGSQNVPAHPKPSETCSQVIRGYISVMATVEFAYVLLKE